MTPKVQPAESTRKAWPCSGRDRVPVTVAAPAPGGCYPWLLNFTVPLTVPVTLEQTRTSGRVTVCMSPGRVNFGVTVRVLQTGIHVTVPSPGLFTLH